MLEEMNFHCSKRLCDYSAVVSVLFSVSWRRLPMISRRFRCVKCKVRAVLFVFVLLLCLWNVMLGQLLWESQATFQLWGGKSLLIVCW
jgi:hypothetical protein